MKIRQGNIHSDFDNCKAQCYFRMAFLRIGDKRTEANRQYSVTEKETGLRERTES